MRLASAAATVMCATLAAGCGGGTRQDVHEAKGSFEMKILKASFPSTQAVARPARLELQVRNTGTKTVPNVAVTVDSFSYTATTPELAANKRPIWAIEEGPGPKAPSPVESQEVSPAGGGQTVYVNTWAQTFSWRVMPVKPGKYTVSYAVAAGLSGKAVAVLHSGGAVHGRFVVNIAAAPPATHVDPRTGKVVAGTYPPIP